jgi:hypothetical protein
MKDIQSVMKRLGKEREVRLVYRNDRFICMAMPNNAEARRRVLSELERKGSRSVSLHEFTVLIEKQANVPLVQTFAKSALDAITACEAKMKDNVSQKSRAAPPA